jgi:hypothetical protein
MNFQSSIGCKSELVDDNVFCVCGPGKGCRTQSWIASGLCIGGEGTGGHMNFCISGGDGTWRRRIYLTGETEILADCTSTNTVSKQYLAADYVLDSTVIGDTVNPALKTVELTARLSSGPAPDNVVSSGTLEEYDRASLSLFSPLTLNNVKFYHLENEGPGSIEVSSLGETFTVCCDPNFLIIGKFNKLSGTEEALTVPAGPYSETSSSISDTCGGGSNNVTQTYDYELYYVTDDASEQQEILDALAPPYTNATALFDNPTSFAGVFTPTTGSDYVVGGILTIKKPIKFTGDITVGLTQNPNVCGTTCLYRRNSGLSDPSYMHFDGDLPIAELYTVSTGGISIDCE